MARPRKEIDISAPEKIEEAFWHLLETIDYSHMTIQLLATTAKVNRNAIYYHYEDINDVAKKAFSNFIKTEIVEEYIQMLLTYAASGKETQIDQRHIESLKKLQACASSNSLYIHNMLKNEIKNIWFKIAHIDEATLTKMDTISIEFAINGIVALLGSKEIQENPYYILEFSKTDIGIAVLKTLLNISKKS